MIEESRVSSAQTGYVLVEILVSTAIVCALLGVLLQFAGSTQGAVRAQADVADLQQRLRVATESLRRDLWVAGAGPSHGVWRGPLIDAFAPVLPGRAGSAGADPELSYYADRISIMYVPDTRSQTTLVANMAGPGAPLLIDGGAPGCPAGGSCGFARGDRALVFAGEAYETFTVSATDVAGSSLSAAAPLSRAYSAGSAVVAIVQRVYYLDRPGKRLMLYDGDRSDLPLVDHVVELRFTYYGDPTAAGVRPPPPGVSSCAYALGDPPIPLLDELGGTAPKLLQPTRFTDGPVCGVPPHRFDADLLRVRRIGVTIRLETEGGEFRGSGPAFFTRGTSPGGNRYIPDVQVSFEVAPRNLAVR
jgi:type II secretory pathway pseudopilin PulG